MFFVVPSSHLINKCGLKQIKHEQGYLRIYWFCTCRVSALWSISQASSLMKFTKSWTGVKMEMGMVWLWYTDCQSSTWDMGTVEIVEEEREWNQIQNQAWIFKRSHDHVCALNQTDTIVTNWCMIWWFYTIWYNNYYAIRTSSEANSQIQLYLAEMYLWIYIYIYIIHAYYIYYTVLSVHVYMK